MIEEELKAGLDRALADEPPFAFDPDALMAAVRRQTSRRRALAGVGAATAAIAVAAVAVPTLLHGHADGVIAAAPASTTTTNTTSRSTAPQHQWPPSGTHPTAYGTARLSELADTWTHEVQRVFPVVVSDAEDVSVAKWGGEAAGAIEPGQSYLGTDVHFTVHGVPASVAVQVDAPGVDTTAPATLCAQESSPQMPARCQITWQGSSALVRETITSTTDPSRVLSVRQYRADGSVVSVTAYNYNEAGDGRVTMAQPPLSDSQLTTLATDPVLSF